MMPMGWNQIRQAKVADVQEQIRHNHMGQNQQQYGHQQMNPQQMGMHGQQHQSYNWNQQQMMHQQQMYSHQMMGHYGMQNPQMMMGIADKPPEPSEPPPPSPPAPLPSDKPPPPPASEAEWWEAEMQNLPTMHHRNELERLSGEKWFQNMNTNQQIECWQHKLQLINKQEKGQGDTTTSNIKQTTSSQESLSQSSRPAIVPAPSVSVPPPIRPHTAIQQTGNVEKDLMKARQEEENIKQQIVTFERQYGEWRKQFEDWKDKHKAHPNKEQFAQYENQWMTWQKQMSDQKTQFDDNLASIKAQIADLEQQKKGQQQETGYGDMQGQPGLGNTSGLQPDFRFLQQGQTGGQKQWMGYNQEQRPSFERGSLGPRPPFERGGMGQRPRFGFDDREKKDFGVNKDQQFGQNNHFQGQRLQGQRFESNHNNTSGQNQRQRFSASGTLDNNNSFQHPTPGFEAPGGFGQNRGQRPRFGNDTEKENHRFRNPGGPRFRNLPPPPSTNEDFGNEEENYNMQLHQNQGIRGPRPGGPVSGFGQGSRGMPRNRFDGPRQRPPRPGMMNEQRFGGPRPRFPGQQGSRGGPRPTRFGVPNHPGFEEDKFSLERKEDFGLTNRFGHNQRQENMNDVANAGFVDDNSATENFFEQEETFNEQLFNDKEGNRSSAPQNMNNQGRGGRGRGRGRGQGRVAESGDWKISRDMVPMSFGISKHNKTTNRLDSFTMHDARPIQDEDSAYFKTSSDKQKIPAIKPEDDYSHYIEEAESSAKADEKPVTAGRGLAHLLGGGGALLRGQGGAANRGRGRTGAGSYRGDFGRGLGGAGFNFGRGRGDGLNHGRGRGSAVAGRGREESGIDLSSNDLVKPPHVLGKEKGQFNEVLMKRLSAMAGIASTSTTGDTSRTNESQQQNLENKNQPPTSSPGSINSETILQKAKELSNFDIKNLLSAVKTFKNVNQPEAKQPGSQSAEGTKIPELTPTARKNEEYSDSQTNFDEATYTATEEHYNRLAREMDRSGLANEDVNTIRGEEPLTEAELVAAGLDPVSLGLRDDDLLLQEYLYNPLLQDGGARDPLRDPLLDPYLERELLLREIQEREAVRRKAELARREAEFRQNIARPILQAQKIVETIDYSHGLKNTDGDRKDGPDRRRTPPRDEWRREGDFRGPPPFERRLGDSNYDRRRFPPISMDERMRMRERGFAPPGMDERIVRDRGWPGPPFDRQRPRSPIDPNSSFVVDEDVVRERESMERRRKVLDQERESMERRRDSMERRQNSSSGIMDSREREIERSKRERSLERLRKMERELMERERNLNEREQRLKSPSLKRARDRRDRTDWKPEGPVKTRSPRRSPPRKRFEDDRPRRRRSRTRSRSPADRDRNRSPRNDSRRRDNDRDRGRELRRSRSPDRRANDSKDRRRFSSPSGDPSRTMSPAAPKRREMPKPRKIEPVMIRAEDLLNDPARQRRPKRIVVILRGLPGSGKTHIAKLIRDIETSKGVTPRVLGLDDYFLVENEKFEKDRETGKIVKRKVHEYEYEAAMEPSYRDSLLKSFKKTLEDGYFNFVIVDSINDKISYFSEFWTAAKKAVFEVYVAELLADVHVCAKRNIHKRRLDEIQKIAFGWEETPSHMIRLDVRQMLQDSEIQEVEMGDISDEDGGDSQKTKLTPEQLAGVPQSKWELMETNERLDKLDGIKKKKLTSSQQDMADFLSVTDDYVQRSSAPGKKRVRWADIAEKSAQRRMREVGFVVGNTDWNRMIDGDSHANQALNRTKFI